jgi:competence protein ComEA
VRVARGTTLFLALLLIGFAAQFVTKPRGIYVSLGPGFPQPGVHQFSDDATPLTVIRMTHLPATPEWAGSQGARRRLHTGETLDLVRDGEKVSGVKRGWMPARQRMTLGIPLSPDRMGVRDWEALPGIGPGIARRIETDRQQNGDFGSLAALNRVPGIGPKHLEAWKRFFRKTKDRCNRLK